VIPEGAVAPGFELPALVDGEKRRVALDEYLGDEVVILAFYPADFNPACDAESCDLDELDLFTMQKDVTILGISPDSVYSHRAFAEQYDLSVPLLADTDGEVARQYDIDFVDDIGQRLLERGVVVVDHDGTVTYSWSTDKMRQLPRVDEIKDALAETGGDDTAFARYRVGHAHYTEGRRSFTSAMESFENTEWVMAQHDFQQAREEFEEAADQFDTAVRFVDDQSLAPIYEGANEKATALWQAADWLTQAASAYSSGSGTKGQKLRDDAEVPMNTVREYAEPPDPDDEWPPDMENLEKAETEDHTILPTETDVEDAALQVDIDSEVGDDEAEAEISAEMAGDGATDTAENDRVTRDAADDEAANAADDEDDIDDDEIAEIQAELAANNPEEEPSVEELTEESTAIVNKPPIASDSEAETDASDADEADELGPSTAESGADVSAEAELASDGQPSAESELASDGQPSADPANEDSTERADTVETIDAPDAATDDGEPTGDQPVDDPVDPAGDEADAIDEPETATDDAHEADEVDTPVTDADSADTAEPASAADDATDESDDGSDLNLTLAESDPSPIDDGGGYVPDDDPADIDVPDGDDDTGSGPADDTGDE